LTASAISLSTFLVAIEFQSTYLYAYQVDQQREAEIREIARKMGVDPEFLLHPEGRKSFDFHAFFASLAEKVGLVQPEAQTAPNKPVDIAASIKQAKERYALVSAD